MEKTKAYPIMLFIGNPNAVPELPIVEPKLLRPIIPLLTCDTSKHRKNIINGPALRNDSGCCRVGS